MKYILKPIAALFTFLFATFFGNILQARSFSQQTEPPIKWSIRTLFKSASWLRFKNFWRKIGLVPPKKNARRITAFNTPYARVLSEKQYKKYRTESKSLLNSLHKNGYPTLELQLLTHIIEERLSNMRYGPMSMFTRMMPSPGIIEKEKSLQRLEKTIDLLIKLRAEKKINSREFNKAMKNLKRDILTISVSKVVSKTYGRFWYRPHRLNEKQKRMAMIEKQLHLIERHYKQYLQRAHKNPKIFSQATANKLHNKLFAVKKELRALRKILPNLMSMIENLEK